MDNQELVTTLEVAAIVREAEDVVSLELRAPSGDALPPWTPGAHVDLILGNGIERQYSLCGDPAEPRSWRVAVLRERESRGGSAYVHDELAVGARLEVRGPRNHFPLLAGDEYRLIAGGIGITPLLAMVEALERSGAPWRMLYGGRRRVSMAFLDRLSRFGDKVECRPEDEFGLLDLRGFLDGLSAGTRVYACGPEPLIEAVEALSGAWPEGVLNVERFHPKDGALDGPDDSFTVVCAISGIEVEIPAGSSIVDVLGENGIDVPTSCREGTCGTCETVVLEGIPDHRDSILTPSEQESNEIMMVCCGRAKSPVLVLDL
jgi:ferredoxin-NADP reductase